MALASGPRRLVASAPGKLVLLGEYAVLTGGPALVTAVERRARVTLAAPCGLGTAARFQLRAPEVGIAQATFTLDPDGQLTVDGQRSALPGLAVLKTVLAHAWRRCVQQGIEGHPLAIDIDSSELCASPEGSPGQKLGLGSSAAVAVSLLLGLFEAWGLRWEEGWVDTDRPDLTTAPAPTAAVLDLACRLHRQAQGGVGSGIDVAAGLLGGLLRYQLIDDQPRAQKLSWPPGLTVLPVWSGRAASTPALLAAVERFRQRCPGAHDTLMARMAEVSGEGLAALAAGAVQSFLGAVDAYGALLAELGRLSSAPIVTAEHEAIAACVRAHGAAYKPSGAGGGDLGVALWAAEPEEGRARLRSVLRQAGFFAVSLHPEIEGASVRPLKP